MCHVRRFCWRFSRLLNKGSGSRRRGRGRGRGRSHREQMAKRGRGSGRGRGGGGGSRGGYIGRGRGRGKGRGGSRGGGRSRGQGRGGFSQPVLGLDGEPDVFIPLEGTMRAAVRRTKQRSRMQDEALNTDEHRDETMNKPLRKRPVEFVHGGKMGDEEVVKLDVEVEVEADADDADDADADDADADDADADDADADADDADDADADDADADADDADDADADAQEASQDPVSKVQDVGTLMDELEAASEAIKSLHQQPKQQPLQPTLSVQPTQPAQPKAKDHVQSLTNDQLFFVDDAGSTPTHIHTREQPDVIAIRVQSGPNTEFTPSLSFGHVHLSTTTNQQGEVLTSLPKATKKLHSLDTFNPEDEELSQLEDALLDDQNQGNKENLYKSYQQYITNVMGNLFEQNEDNDEEDEAVFAELDDDFEEEAKFIAEGYSNDESIDDEASSNIQQMKIKSEEPQDEDPQYGFLAEDYETFDNSLIDVFNIREGFSSSQYQIKSFRLMGTYDTQWVDRELFEDFLMENGMPEHRLNAYFKYIKARLQPDEPDEKDYDIPFSDSSDDEDEDGEDQGEMDTDDDMMEGLDDLIQFTKKYDGVRDIQFETQTIKTKGKGRKKQLDLESIHGEFGDLLQKQWSQDRQNKRDKRAKRESNIAEEHAKSADLCLKYPHTLHIKDMHSELDAFLHDSNRKSLTFPPLDPHGNKTVQNLVHAFNMKSRKFGSTYKQHVVVIKNKRTYRSLPDHYTIERILRQRPVFNRTDAKRSRAEIDSEKSSRRGNPSKAHVKEGDIVGEDAPELASDNFGRMLLIKMGWKRGQGLGAEGSGISEPVMAKVKKTKLGIR